MLVILIFNLNFFIYYLSIELMTSLLSHPDLVVQDSEQNVYMMVLKWLYRCLTKIKEKRRSHCEIASYFCQRKGKTKFKPNAN